MDYIQAVDSIHALARFGSKPGLGRIQTLMARLGNPQGQIPFVHVAGTNGKGSTSAMIAAVLQEAGYRVGLFISPYVSDFRERIQVDGAMISPPDFAALMDAIFPLAVEMEAEGDSPTEFEVLTAAALCHFGQTACDVAVLEVGLGGRLDSTNIIPPPLCAVITAIDFDHMDVLGDTLEAIAGEKCGIIKPGSTVVSDPVQRPEALAVIMAHCARHGTTLRMANAAAMRVERCGLDGSLIHYRGLNLSIPLMGAHQQRNALTALETLFALRERGYTISDHAIIQGLAGLRFAARLEILQQSPLLLLDGAHNPAGARALAQALTLLEGRRVIGIAGMLRDKDCGEALAQVGPHLHRLFTVTPDNPRALPAESLAALAGAHCAARPCATLEEAWALALSGCGPEDVLLVWGSLYLAAQFRDAYGKGALGAVDDPGQRMDKGENI